MKTFMIIIKITIKSGVKKEIMSTRRTFLIYFSSFILINNGKLKCQKVLKATFMKIPLFLKEDLSLAKFNRGNCKAFS